MALLNRMTSSAPKLPNDTFDKSEEDLLSMEVFDIDAAIKNIKAY